MVASVPSVNVSLQNRKVIDVFPTPDLPKNTILKLFFEGVERDLAFQFISEDGWLLGSSPQQLIAVLQYFSVDLSARDSQSSVSMKLIVYILALCTVCTVAKLASDVPLFMWSGEKYIIGKNLAISTELATPDVEYLFESIVTRNAVPTPFTSVLHNPYPEVLVIFLEPHLSLTQLSSCSELPTLKSVMQVSSAGSFYAPYVGVSDSLSSSVIQTAYLVDKSASVFYAGKGAKLLPELKSRVPKVKAVSLNNLQKTLSSSKIYNNGVVDLVIVHLDTEDSTDKLSRSNEIIFAVNSFVSDKTANYVAVYTGLSSYENDSQKRVLMELEMIVDDLSDNSTNVTGTWFQIFFPGWFWEITVVFLFLIPIVITGFFQLMSIQTPNIEERSKKQHRS